MRLLGIPIVIAVLSLTAASSEGHASVPLWHFMTGGWNHTTCDNDAISYAPYMTPSERWESLKCGELWNDCVNFWKSGYAGKNNSFLRSLEWLMPIEDMSGCGDLDITYCQASLSCYEAEELGLGVSSLEIMNSFVDIKSMYRYIYDSMQHVQTGLILDKHEFEGVVGDAGPYNNEWLEHLHGLFINGPSLWASPMIYLSLSRNPWFWKNETTAREVGNITLGLIEQMTSTARDMYDLGQFKKMIGKGDTFSSYMFQVFPMWQAIIEESLYRLYNGTDKSLALLTSIISDGKLCSGSYVSDVSSQMKQKVGGEMMSSLNKNNLIMHTFFIRILSVYWRLLGEHPFVLDSGYECDQVDETQIHLQVYDTSHTGVCYKNKRYYLVSAHGDPVTSLFPPCYGCLPPAAYDTRFSMPKGAENLVPSTHFEGITIEELVAGAVNTYERNGNLNLDTYRPDPLDLGGAMVQFPSLNITAAGYVDLPVCDATTARKAWNHPDRSIRQLANYPCVEV